MVVLDYREHELIALLPEASVESLDIGDIWIGTMVIERKTASDFSASIIDGRWREQKQRLTQSGRTILYIIEGALEGRQIPATTLRSAMVNTMLRDHIHVIHTMSIVETVAYVKILESKPLVENSLAVMGCVQSKRKKFSTPAIILTRQLMCVPGVSESIASRVVAQYPTFGQFQHELIHHPASFRQIAISDTRKIGAKLLQSLVRTFT